MWRMRVAICSHLHELSIMLLVVPSALTDAYISKVYGLAMLLAKYANMQPMMQMYVLGFGRWVWKPHNLPYRKQSHGLKSQGQGGLNGRKCALIQDYHSRKNPNKKEVC